MRSKFEDTLPSLKWVQSVPFRVWYCAEFPLARLRYRDLYEMDANGRQWRQALLEDIKARGIRGGPLLVYNHQHTDPELSLLINKPYYLRVGRNRRWVFEQLGVTTAPCIVTGDIEYPAVELTRDTMLQYLTDGDWEVTKQGITVRNKADASQFRYPA